MSAESSKMWLSGRAAGIVEAAQEAQLALVDVGADPLTAEALRKRLLGLVRKPEPQATSTIRVDGPMRGPLTTDQPGISIGARGAGAPGWTARDEFAARAMQTLLATDTRPPAGGSAVQAYAVADEMLAARDGAPPHGVDGVSFGCLCIGAVAGAPHQPRCPGYIHSMKEACVRAALSVVRRSTWTEKELTSAIEQAKP